MFNIGFIRFGLAFRFQVLTNSANDADENEDTNVINSNIGTHTHTNTRTDVAIRLIFGTQFLVVLNVLSIFVFISVFCFI